MSIQTTFHAGLLDAAKPVPEGLTDGEGRPAGRRYSVYRNNVAVSLREALTTGFPVTRKLIGEQNFDHVAGLYLRAHPPSDPRLMLYGAGLPNFLASLSALSHIGYLADVARLELAIRHSYHAADGNPIDGNALAHLDPDQVMALHLNLAPSARVLRSPWPVLSIWQFTQDASVGKPKAGSQDVLITRPAFDPQPQLLPTGGATFISALTSMPLGDAAEAALRSARDFDPSATLGLLLAGRALEMPSC